ncbi:metal-sensitive transcriptional regulator [Kitasatospora sp. NPDC093806]|uniref:metal-sensitive transcriptional regulator n=1 Tax=Kitasatospora sp. NPDC093806 TaxID=3155075 RepID=UPI0034433844
MTGMTGYHHEKDQLLRRLRRVEGQVRGIQRMVDADSYCTEVLTQISATTKALQSVALRLLDDHLGHCVQDAIARGGEDADAKVTEATQAIARLLRA